MKIIPLLLAVAALALSLPACATAPKKAQCCGTSCDASQKCPPTHSHDHSHSKKKSQ